MLSRPILAAALALATSAVLPAAAQPVSGLYLGLGLGPNLWKDNSSRGIGIHDRDVGWAGVAAFGWGYGNGLRAELEVNYRGQEIERLSVNKGTAGRSGQVDRYGVMANVLYDFDLSSLGISPRVWQPYVGVGVGYSYVNFRNVRFSAGGSRYDINDGGGSFAYQAIVGSAFPLSDNWAITAEYRILDTLQPDVSVNRPSGAGAAGIPGTIRPRGTNMSGLIGVRYQFDRPPAPPQAGPQPVPFVAAPLEAARTFIVFFDFNSARLTDRATQVITEAASNARRLSATRVELAGHADLSGTPAYNQRLSRRRAEVVAQEMVRQGVRRGDIAISAFGETRPLVPTANGVREPQNRRVEIVIR